jgi:hypothetical protein
MDTKRIDSCCRDMIGYRPTQGTPPQLFLKNFIPAQFIREL